MLIMFDDQTPSPTRPQTPPARPMPPTPVAPRPSAPVASSAPASAMSSAPKANDVEDMFADVKDAPAVRPAPTPGMPGAPSSPVLSSPAKATTSSASGMLALKVGLAFVVVVGLAGGTIYFLNARSQAAKNNLPPVAPIVEEEPTPTTPTTPTTPVVVTPLPETPTTPTTPTPARDTDADGLSDDQERVFGTDPTAKDTDGDNLSDYEEVINYGTNPLQRDTDADGLSDDQEILNWKTDPKKVDTDGDTFSDKTEIDNGYNPNGPGKLADQPSTSGTEFDAKFKAALETQMNVYRYAKDESKSGVYYFIADRLVNGQWQSVIWMYDVTKDSQWKTSGTVSVAAGSSVVLSQSPRGNDTLDPQWRTAGIADNKFVFASTPVDDSPGPCFSPWHYSSLYYIDLGVANPTQKPYTLTAQDEASAQAESDACMKTL